MRQSTRFCSILLSALCLCATATMAQIETVRLETICDDGSVCGEINATRDTSAVPQFAVEISVSGTANRLILTQDGVTTHRSMPELSFTITGDTIQEALAKSVQGPEADANRAEIARQFGADPTDLVPPAGRFELLSSEPDGGGKYIARFVAEIGGATVLLADVQIGQAAGGGCEVVTTGASSGHSSQSFNVIVNGERHCTPEAIPQWITDLIRAFASSKCQDLQQAQSSNCASSCGLACGDAGVSSYSYTGGECGTGGTCTCECNDVDEERND